MSMKSLKNKNLVYEISEKKSEAMTLGPKEKRVPVMRQHEGRPSGKPAPSAPPSTMSQYKSKDRCWEGYEPTPGKKPYEEGSCKPVSKADKPFHGYNPKRHAKEGGLNDKFREKYNREHGSHLKRPVTGKVKPGSKAAKRRRSFCARMSGVPGPTSKDGKLTPKGASLKRWKCKSEEVSKGGPGSGIKGHVTNKTKDYLKDRGKKALLKLLQQLREELKGNPADKKDILARIKSVQGLIESKTEENKNLAKEKQVAAIAVMSGSKMLMGKRKDNGKYTNPGGHLEGKEAPHEGAAREVLEEAGIKVDPKKLEHLGHKDIELPSGKKRVHAFKLVVDADKIKPHSKNDPDKEVGKWEWIETKGGLPKHVKENLHTPHPRNLLLDKLSIKSFGLFVTDLIKAGPHKYIRKYMRGGKWVYVYHEAGHQPRQIPEEAVHHIKKLAELGDEHAKALHDSIEAHSEEKLKVLRQLADLNDQAAIDHLKSLGIDRAAERLEEKLIPAQVNKDESEMTLDEQRHNKAVETIKGAVDNKIYRHLAGHANSPYAARIASIPLQSVVDAVKSKKNIKAMLEELHKQMSRIDEAHRGLPQSQNQSAVSAGGYGSLAYNAAVASLESNGILPRGYSQVHRRGPERSVPEHVPFRGLRERQEREDRERQEREARERQEREERERRELAEVEGSMAHYMSQISERPLSVPEIRRLHSTVKQIFGENLRKEHWPYDFSNNGYTVKIKSMSFSERSIQFSFSVKDRNGAVVTERWQRTWSKQGGGVVDIHNDYLAVNPSARGADAPIGSLINKSQVELLRRFAPEKGQVTVYAALDVGGYNWANQGFSFEDSDIGGLRSAFGSFLARKGINLTEQELRQFTLPAHFAAFTDGHLYEHNAGSEIPLSKKQKEHRTVDGKPNGVPLTSEELRKGKTARMMVHLGKKFLLGRAWNGIMKVRDMTPDNEAFHYFQNYNNARDRAWSLLKPGYRMVVERVMGERAGAAVTRAPDVPPMPTSAAARRRRSPSVRRPRGFDSWEWQRQERWINENRPRLSRAAYRNAHRVMMETRSRSGGTEQIPF